MASSGGSTLTMTLGLLPLAGGGPARRPPLQKKRLPARGDAGGALKQVQPAHEFILVGLSEWDDLLSDEDAAILDILDLVHADNE